MIKKVSFYLLGYFFTLMMLSSCNYDYINPEPIVIPTDSISFKSDIIPMFSKCVGCHPAVHAPDLTPANAYQSLMTNNLINKQDPPTSIFYEKITGTGSMKSYGLTDQDCAYILLWIKQGANNN